MAGAGYPIPVARTGIFPLVDVVVSRHDEGVSGKRRVTKVLGLAALLLAAAAEPAVASDSDQAQNPGDEPSLAAFQGQYVFSGGESQRQAMRQEIDDATEDLNVALRALARRKIWKSQEPSRMMTIKVEGDSVSIVRSGGKPEFVGKVGGGSFAVDGKYRGRIKWRGGKLLVDITGGDQHTTVRFTLNPDSHSVVMRTTIDHSMLPRPVRLKKTFRALG